MKDSLVVNMSDREVKRQLMSQIGRLSGPYEILIRQVKATRSLNQNRYYFAAVCTPFRDWLREIYGDSAITTEQAHEMLKVKIMGLDEKETETGEKLVLIPRSKTLNVEEFEEYIEKCSAWMAEFCEIIVVPCESFYERETK